MKSITARANAALQILGICFLTAALPVSAQEPGNDAPRPHYGIFGTFRLNFHGADFRALPGVPSCCPQFESGNGSGFAGGILFEYPFGTFFRPTLRIGYADLSGVLTAEEVQKVNIDGRVHRATIEHSIDAPIAAVGIEPLLGLNIAGPVTAYVGLRGDYLLGAEFSQQEELVDPASGTFENDSRIRNQSSGDIPGTNPLLLSPTFGLALSLPLNSSGTLLLTPELFASFGLGSVTRDVSWSIGSFRFGASLRFAPDPSSEDAPALPTPPTPPPPVVARNDSTGIPAEGTVTLVGLDGGVELPAVTVRVEEFIATEAHPLLPYLFFPPNSAELPDRYHRLTREEKEAFRLADLYNRGTLPTYYDLLNVVGRRMTERPEARLTITGCRADSEDERTADDLSLRRARAVHDYLQQVWGIDEDRLEVVARALPARPSVSIEPTAHDENRRAELYSNDPEILAPVFTDDTLRTVSPPSLRLHVATEVVPRSWQALLMQGTDTLELTGGEGPPPAYLEWDLKGKELAEGSDSLRAAIMLHNGDDASVRFNAPPLEVNRLTLRRKRIERIDDRRIDRYSLILFDFDRADLSSMDSRIAEFIRSNLSSNSVLNITGSTDRIGEDEHNRALSLERARRVAVALGRPDADVEGLGESNPPYDNTLPEGRFYSRMVSVVVETPITGSD